MANTLSGLYLRDPEAASAIRRQQLAEALMMQGQGQRVTHPTQALSTIAHSLVGAMLHRNSEGRLREAGERQRAGRDAFMQQVMGVMGGGAPAPAAPASPAPAATPGAPVAPPVAPAGGGAPAPAGGGAPAPGSVPPDLLPLFQRASAQHGIPLPLLLAQAQQESSFNPNARGRSGEIGLMQIMPSTARDPGFGVPPVDPATLTDPAANIDFGARYLRARGGLAAYNGGGDPNYVQNVMRRVPQFAALAGPQQDAPPVPSGAPAATPGAAAAPGASAGNVEGLRRLAIQAAMSSDPDLQRLAPVLAQFAAREAPRAPISVGEGGRVVDPTTGRVIYEAPRDPTRDPLERVVGPDGQPRLVPRSEAAGQTPFVPEARPPALMPPEVEEQQRRLREAGRASTTVVNQGENAFARSLAGVTAETIRERQTQAMLGRDAVESATRIEGLLANGAITGTGAEWRTTLERGLATAGLIDGERVTNTEQLMAEIARSVLPLAASLKGPTSDRDIAFLREAVAGRISATPDVLRRMARIQRSYGVRAVQDWNRVAAAIAEEPGATGAARSVFAPLEMPAEPAQAPAPGQAPAAGAPAAPDAGAADERRSRAVQAIGEARRLLGPDASDDDVVRKARELMR